MKRRGLFISVEGPEGSGKSSQAKRLASALRRAGRRVMLVHDPGSTRLGVRIRAALLHEPVTLSPLVEALLFIAARRQLLEERIRPALRRGQVVICDRYHDSTIAYQGFGGGLDVAWLRHLGRRAIDGLLPDMTVLLDVPPSIGLARLSGSRDRIERKARLFHERVRRGYLRIARQQPRRVRIIDATQSPDIVHQQVLDVVSHRLNRRST